MLQHKKDVSTNDWLQIGKMALITKVELQDAVDESVESVIEKIILEVLSNFR
jgi:hypothetical protein